MDGSSSGGSVIIGPPSSVSLIRSAERMKQRAALRSAADAAVAQAAAATEAAALFNGSEGPCCPMYVKF
jgi:hypothetical protein